MADDVAALLRHLHVGMAHSVGASLGGMIGRWFAVRHPQRCLPLTAVMTGDFPVPGGPAVPPLGERAAANMRTKTDHLERDAAADACVSAWRSDSGSAVPFDEDLTRACGEHPDDRAYHPAGLGRQLTAIAPGLHHAEARIAAPTVVIHGDADPIFARPHAQTVAANIPDTELEVVPGMGHEMPPPLWPRLRAAIERAAARAGAGAPGA